jgi:putative ATP-binding cassette transporter
VKVLLLLVRVAGRWLVLGALAGLVAGTALAALMGLVHRAVTGNGSGAGMAALAFGLLALLYLACTLVADHSLKDVSEALQADVRLNILRQLLDRPLRGAEALGEARILSLLVNDVRLIADFVCRVPVAFVDFATAAGCLLYMAWLSPVAFGFNILFLAVAAACYVVPERAARGYLRRAADAMERHMGQIQFGIRGMKLLLLSRPKRRDFLGKHFQHTAGEIRALNRRGGFFHAFAERFAESVALGYIAFLVFILPRYAHYSAATATGLVLAAIFARAPLKDLLGMFSRVRRTQLAVESIERAGLKVWAEPAAEAEVSAAPFRDLELVGARFEYEGDHGQKGFAAGPFDVRLEAGEILFIVGGNGAGKTTLAKLLCGLYPPSGGRVLMNSGPVEGVAGQEAHRALFCAAFTDDPLFTHVLGIPGSEADAGGGAWLRELRLEHTVRMEDGRFSTIDLSQGQRRRMVLLSALVEDRPVLLLDEWAADQDPGFRAFFYDHIIPDLRARGKTLVLITHDDRYFDRADRLLKIEGGRLVPMAQPEVVT